ncbi:hypothetical protein K491DRAFT_673328 [Lophiostoma macrostomum CBS 122681]|uniref:Uncharacterized protein n=1 Tax=Lophiostoma macrostomum CBS 122681 TaxID=1314788 RepID=A0A6A6TR25_9PLEO|nr:hypothetical protein K491DRAFT_673328 [Lophiostoma macrostomum CBS 122681]
MTSPKWLCTRTLRMMEKLAEATKMEGNTEGDTLGSVSEKEKEARAQGNPDEKDELPTADDGPSKKGERTSYSNLPPYLRDELLSGSGSSSSATTRRTASPVVPAPPVYYDSQPSSQPPDYMNKSLQSRPKSTPRTLTPSTPSEIASVCPPPPAHWAVEDNRKRGFRERMKDLFQSDSESRSDEGRGPKRGSQPVANVFGVRVSSVKARESRPGRKAGSWR